jgi:mono/diheme cytochrome c family protein
MWSRTVILAIFVGVMAAAASAQQPTHRSTAQEGRLLALAKCDVCHVVASDQQYPPLISHFAPSFYDVASMSTTNAQSLESFLAHRHWHETMPSPDLTPDQVTDLTSYILSLRGRH